MMKYVRLKGLDMMLWGNEPLAKKKTNSVAEEVDKNSKSFGLGGREENLRW